MPSISPQIHARPHLSGVLRQIAEQHPRLTAGLVLLLWTLAVRLPFIHVIGDDEAFFSVVASRWLRGELPYVASYDIKAPGMFALFAAVQFFVGSGLAQIKAIEILFIAWGAYSLHRMLTDHGSPAMAFWAAGLYPIYSLFQEGTTFPTQHIQMALTIAAVRLMLDAGRADERRALGILARSGLMIGCAVMVKQTAAFEGLALFGWLAWQCWQRKTVWPLAVFCGVAPLPTLGFGLYFAATGHFTEAFNDVVMSALQRSQLDMWIQTQSPLIKFFRRPLNFLAMIKPLLVITAGALLAVLRLGRVRAVAPRLIALTLLWYVTAAIGVLMVKSPDLYCGFPLMTPTVILFVGVLCHGIDFKPRQRNLYMALYMTAAVAQPMIMEREDLFPGGYLAIPDYRASVLGAESLRKQGIKPGDNLLVLSRGHYVYLFTQTLPKAKYFNAMHLLCNFPTPDADPLGAAFDSRPQYILLSDMAYVMGCLNRDRLPQIYKRLDADYDHVSTVRGDWDGFNVYKRKPGH
ncbi:hypothetical protein [Asticcacaulis sp. 201]|uniref:ArnT family glycosyltransferase n=1 Tax=Asticcacaulis sp. 201 TaxID=3028787 RepID=UPI0029163E1D|nr:hypothetical protein [Asticcacaulis sp. 201]MDV6332089.1 hypothetical protein [Asticcacaulis sp. 201]